MTPTRRRVILTVVGAVWTTLTAAQPAVPPKDNSPLGKARSAVATGRYTESTKLLKPLATQDPVGDAALELGLLLAMLGRRAEAATVLEPIAAADRARSAAELTRAARAARALDRFEDANALFRQAVGLAADDPAINTAWGELFLEKYNRQDALRSFQAALRRAPEYAPALLGMARATAEDNPPGAMMLVKRALAVDPTLVGAHLFIAELELDQGRRPEANAALTQALEINPSSLEAIAQRGAVAYLEGRKADFDAAVAKALAINPTYGEVFRVAGDLAARNYRFDEAVALARQALALDPSNARAHGDIGVHLMRTGDEPAARQALERAFEADPYDVVTYNMLALLDTLDKFETITDGNLVVRLHPEEAAIMKEYVLPLAHEALGQLSKRYGFEPKGPILIEVFPRHDDFAVRNVGLPGMIGALGACFGRVVTMDSPRARPPGSFNWGATLWHELAHVITLQMSNQRLPRWLSEGVSVFEETRARREWGREMELAFAQKLDAGGAIKLRDLNAAFQNPQLISLAYYQGSLVVDHIVSTYGEPALHKLVRTYAQGLEGEAAIKAGLGVDFDKLQTGFDQTLDRRFGKLRLAMRAPDGLAAAPPDRLQALAAEHPESYPVHVALGLALWRANDLDGATRALEKAAALAPMATGKESPHALLAEIAIARGDRGRAIAELEALLAFDHTDVESARRLAALVDASTQPERAAGAHARVIGVDPFDATSHSALGRLALARKDFTLAAREFRVALAAGPIDLAAAHCDLAETYLLGGKRADAKRQALRALEVAPTYERAQDLLLKLVEGLR